MSRAAGYFLDADVAGSSNNANTIITSRDDAFGYSNEIGLADMDSVGVGAVFGGSDAEVVQPDVLALCDEDVEPFAVN